MKNMEWGGRVRPADRDVLVPVITGSVLSLVSRRGIPFTRTDLQQMYIKNALS